MKAQTDEAWRTKGAGAKRRIPTGSALLRTIRQHCIECFGGAVRDVPLCSDRACYLFPFRMGAAGFEAGANFDLDGGGGHAQYEA